MKIGFLYAGQGSQRLGMGRDFYEKYPRFAQIMDFAEEYAGFDVKQLCFEGPKEKLGQTRYTQPAMVAFAVGVTNLLRDADIIPEYSMGLSLGEYSALYAAGILNEEEAIKIVTFRGKVMENAMSGRKVKMASIIGLDDDAVVSCCQNASNKDGVVYAVNFNCHGNVTVTGDEQAVEQAMKLAIETGALKVVPLDVSVASHTPLMKPAGDALAGYLADMDINDRNALSSVVYNCIGREKNNGEEITDLLVRQVQSPVQVEKSIRYMADCGVDTFVEIGPGNVLSKLAKRIVKGCRRFTIDTADDFENLKENIKLCL